MVAVSRGIIGMQKWGIAACGRVSAGLALSVCIAAAAEIKSFPNLKDDSVEISISGNIAPGDIDVLRASIKAANDAGKLVTSLRLNSDGGNLIEAVRVADWVKSAKISTKVGRAQPAHQLAFSFSRQGKPNTQILAPVSVCIAPPRRVSCLVLLPRRWQTSRRNWMFPGQSFAA